MSERVTERAFVASAPGKLVLAGEYAVTEGYPAVVAAVDVRARATRSPAPALVLEGNSPRALDAVRDRAELARRLPLLAAVAQRIEESGTSLPCAHVRVDTTAFSRSSQKVGLGSSAAASVALTRALLPVATRDEVHAVARDAHRAFQGGGSGIDVAASTFGGILWFARDAVVAAPHLPASLATFAVFVGHPTSTQGFVDRYRSLPDRAAHAKRLAECAVLFRDACAHDNAAELIGAIDAARAAMDALGHAASIDIVSAPHQRVADLARAHGGAAKPSGAGGGDVAFGAVPLERAAALRAAYAAADLLVLDVQLGAEGVRIDA